MLQKSMARQKLRGWNGMSGRLIVTFVLTWVCDRGKNEAVAFGEGTDLYPTVGNSWVQQQLGSATIKAHVI